MRSQESLGNGFPPSVMQVSLTLSPDLCSGRKSPWIWGGEGGSVMQKFNRVTNRSLQQFLEFWMEKIFLGYDINYLSIWRFMCYPWFPMRKASKLTFACFQLAGWWPCDCFAENKQILVLRPFYWEIRPIKGQMLR